jgi:hypothetical protein
LSLRYPLVHLACFSVTDNTNTAKEAQRDQQNVTPPSPPGTNGSNGSSPEKGRKGQRWWESYKTVIVGAVVTVVLASLAGPVRDWVAGAGDAVHDIVLRVVDWNGARVDDMKERIEHRPIWVSGPHFMNSSLAFVADHCDDEYPLVALSGYGVAKPRVLSVDELVSSAQGLGGEPIIIIGRLNSEVDLGGESTDLGTDELILTGADHFMYVATGGSGPSSVQGGEDHGIVAALGVVIATGQVNATGAPAGVESVYFYALEGVSVSPEKPLFRQAVHELSVNRDHEPAPEWVQPAG